MQCVGAEDATMPWWGEKSYAQQILDGATVTVGRTLPPATEFAYWRLPTSTKMVNTCARGLKGLHRAQASYETTSFHTNPVRTLAFF